MATKGIGMGRRVILTMTSAVALLLVGAMGAFACTNLATLNLSTSQASAGSTVDVTGSSFSEVADDVQPVQIRWNATDGPVLAEAEPDATGTFATEITVPSDAQAGQHVLVATQMSGEPGHGLEAGEADLAPIFGTPARASLTVGSPGETAAIDSGAPTGVTGDTGSGLVALSALLALAALGLFAGSVAVFTREVRDRRRQPETSPVSSPPKS